MREHLKLCMKSFFMYCWQLLVNTWNGKWRKISCRMCNLWSTPQKFLHTTDLRFYLYRSVQNGCLNYIRNKKVEEGYRNKAEMVTEDFFYNVLLEEEIFIRLRKAVDELPEKYRVVINLNLDGLSDKEIAERLGITLDAVKQQKKRGKERLREHLDHPFLILFLIFL